MSDEINEEKKESVKVPETNSPEVKVSEPTAPVKDEMADWGSAMNEQTTAEKTSSGSDNLDAWAEALTEQKTQETTKVLPETEKNKENKPSHKVKTMEGDFKRADLEKLTESTGFSSEEAKNLDVVLDIPVTISMEVGKTEISIRNLMKLNQGSVVELDRFAGESLDVYVNGTLIAHGEVVVVNEKFGIRLTDVISAQERISKLG